MAASNSTIALPARLANDQQGYGHDQEMNGVPFLKRKVEFAAREKICHGMVLGSSLEYQKIVRSIGLQAIFLRTRTRYFQILVCGDFVLMSSLSIKTSKGNTT